MNTNRLERRINTSICRLEIELNENQRMIERLLKRNKEINKDLTQLKLDRDTINNQVEQK